jgi:outer membrane protein assembly factor BamB
MLTPLVYDDYLYNCRINGSLRCYRAKTGELIYKESLGRGGFSASAVAANGKIYFTNEDGEVFVVAAGPEYKLLAINALKDICMATPAISDDTLFFRTQHYLIAISEK